MGTLERPDGSITNPGQDTLKHLMETHFSQASKLKETSYKNGCITENQINSWQQDWISVGKLNITIYQFQNKKSPGSDRLRP